MRGDKNQSIPQGKKYIVVPKKYFKKVLQNFISLDKRLKELKKEMIGVRGSVEATIEKEVIKNLDGRAEKIDAILTEVILQKEVLIEKGLLRREDMNKKHEELRKR